MTKENIAVMYGGRSAEHEISVITALQAVRALDPARYTAIPIYLALNGKWYTGSRLFDRSAYKNMPAMLSQAQEITLLPDPTIGGFSRLPDLETLPIDVCLMAFHGQYGEDGCLQGLLELADLPYTGCGVLASSLTMDKAQAKARIKGKGVPVLPGVLVTKEEAILNLAGAKERILQKLQFPLFVKPNHLGSSIGISSADDMASLDAALAKVFQYDSAALVEPQVKRLMELNVAILDGDPPITSAIEMPVASSGALSFEDKYLRGGSKTSGGNSAGMAGLTRVIDPPDLDPGVKKRVIAHALTAFKALGCSGVCRLDFSFDIDTGILYFNELNPIPGSLSYYLWDTTLLYTELLNRLLERAKARKAMQRSLKRELGFRALR